MAGYFEYSDEELDVEAPVMFSLRELRAIELLIEGDTFAAGSPWAIAADSASAKLVEAIVNRRVTAEIKIKAKF